jgi:uncharacterized membrane protein YtjA (UPF0391 family)
VAVIVFIISIVAGFFGFSGISAAAAGIAKVLFFIFIVLFIVFLIIAFATGAMVLRVGPALAVQVTLCVLKAREQVERTEMPIHRDGSLPSSRSLAPTSE